jgi:hypothetical protein
VCPNRRVLFDFGSAQCIDCAAAQPSRKRKAEA